MKHPNIEMQFILALAIFLMVALFWIWNLENRTPNFPEKEEVRQSDIMIRWGKFEKMANQRVDQKSWENFSQYELSEWCDYAQGKIEKYPSEHWQSY